MRTLIIATVITFLAFPARDLQAQGEEKSYIRLSVKTILENDGSLPNYDTYQGTRTERLRLLNQKVDRANRILVQEAAPYLVDLVETVELEGLSEWNGFFDIDEPCAGDTGTDAALPDCCRHFDDRPYHDCGNRLYCLNNKVAQNPELYAFRDNAVNAYAFSCSGSDNNGALWDGVVIFRPNANGPNVLHELGHHMSLSHTHSNEQKLTCETPKGVSGSIPCAQLSDDERRGLGPGDDRVRDTYPDHTCWTINDMSLNHCNAPYDQAPLPCRTQIDATYANVMSYHNPQQANANWNLNLERQSRITQSQLNHIDIRHTANRPHDDLVQYEERRELPTMPTKVAFVNTLLRLDPAVPSNETATATWVPSDSDEKLVKNITFARDDVYSPIFHIYSRSAVIWDGYAESIVETSPSNDSIGAYNDALVFSPDPRNLLPNEPKLNVTYTVTALDDGNLGLRVAMYDGDNQEFSEKNITLVEPSLWWLLWNRALEFFEVEIVRTNP